MRDGEETETERGRGQQKEREKGRERGQERDSEAASLTPKSKWTHIPCKVAASKVLHQSALGTSS